MPLVFLKKEQLKWLEEKLSKVKIDGSEHEQLENILAALGDTGSHAHEPLILLNTSNSDLCNERSSKTTKTH